MSGEETNSPPRSESTSAPLPKRQDESLYGFHAASDRQPEKAEHATEIPEQNAAQIKEKARELGADLVGICALDRQWLYESNTLDEYREKAVFSRVIVIAVAMKAAAFRDSPSPTIRQETTEGYRRMEQVAGSLGRNIADAGYAALSTGNGEALSVPQAIEAGLGTLGRNGMLLTEPFGACLRICKVFTDMPLQVEPAPRTYLCEFCQDCDRCVQACPAGAIESGPAPSETRWEIHTSRCGAYWRQANRECAACISACPLTWGEAGETPGGR